MKRLITNSIGIKYFYNVNHKDEKGSEVIVDKSCVINKLEEN